MLLADLIDLTWEAGRAFERARIAELYDEFDTTWRLTPHRSYEEQVADRLEHMKASDPQWRERQWDRDRAHVKMSAALGAKMPPAYTDWTQVRDTVTPTVWERIFYDLAPSTRRSIAHLAPRGWPRGRLAVAR